MSHSHDGVARNKWKFSAKRRQIFRESVSTAPPSPRGTPTSSGRTPWL